MKLASNEPCLWRHAQQPRHRPAPRCCYTPRCAGNRVASSARSRSIHTLRPATDSTSCRQTAASRAAQACTMSASTSRLGRRASCCTAITSIWTTPERPPAHASRQAFANDATRAKSAHPLAVDVRQKCCVTSRALRMPATSTAPPAPAGGINDRALPRFVGAPRGGLSSRKGEGPRPPPPGGGRRLRRAGGRAGAAGAGGGGGGGGGARGGPARGGAGRRQGAGRPGAFPWARRPPRGGAGRGGAEGRRRGPARASTSARAASRWAATLGSFSARASRTRSYWAATDFASGWS